jgi:hypothetical protein
MAICPLSSALNPSPLVSLIVLYHPVVKGKSLDPVIGICP